jgi:hypothetical protein
MLGDKKLYSIVASVWTVWQTLIQSMLEKG